MIGLARVNVFILIFFLWMKSLGYYTLATHSQLTEGYTESSNSSALNTVPYLITTETDHSTQSHSKEENTKIHYESGHPTNVLQKTTDGYYPEVSLTTAHDNTKDDLQESSNLAWVVTSSLLSKIPSESSIPILQRESVTTPLTVTNIETNDITSNIQSTSPSAIPFGISKNTSHKLELTSVNELTEDYLTTESVTKIPIQSTVIASTVNPTMNQTSSTVSMNASFQNTLTVTRNDSKINQTSYRGQVNPRHATETNFFHLTPKRSSITPPNNYTTEIPPNYITQTADSEVKSTFKYYHSTTAEIDDFFCHHDSDCNTNEVCGLQTKDQYICLCMSGFVRNKKGICVPGIHVSLESTLTYPTNMTSVKTPHSNNGASIHMEGSQSSSSASLSPLNLESGQKRFFFKHLSNLTASERNHSIISIAFASNLDVIEWFHAYDDIFRQTIVFLIARNTSEENSTDTEQVIYIAPTPTKINGLFSISFMVQCPHKMENACQSAAEVVKKLKDKYSQLEGMLKLQITSIEMGYARNSLECKLCTTPNTGKSELIYYLAIGILLVVVMALLSILIHKFYGNNCGRQRTSEEKYSHRRRYTPGRHLATDMQCTDGEIREISNHSELSEEAAKYLNNSSPHSAVGIEAVGVYNDNSSDTEVSKRTHNEISIEEEETHV